MRAFHRALLVGLPLAVVLAGATVWLSTRGDDPRLAGAERLADGEGPETLGAAWVGHVDLDDLTLDDLPMDGTTVVRAGGDDDVMFLVEGISDGYFDAYLVRSSTSGNVDRVGPVFVDPGTTAFNVATDGEYATARGVEMFVALADWLMPDRGTRIVASFDVGAVDAIGDEPVLVGSRHGPYVDAVSPDGTSRRLLGPAGDPNARVTTDEPLGRIVSLARLSDERIAFVADTADGYRLYVLDDEGVRLVETARAFSNPVRSSGAHPTDGTVRGDRLAMMPLARGPDGRVVTVGVDRGGEPEINLVDLDTGEIELLASLEGLKPTIDEPISAAIAGDDLIFTAEGSIWRLADAAPP